MLDETQLISNVSQSFNLMAKALSQTGDTKTAELLHRRAADLELASPELRKCWGGPFNGQKGRQALVDDLLRIVNPATLKS